MTKVDDRLLIYGALGLVGVVLLYFAGKKVADLGGGIVSGNNALTKSQANASGQPTDAYVNKGAAGTLGAIVNTATGGFAASLGESLGGWAFDLWGPKVDINAPGPALDLPIDMGKPGGW